MSCNLYHLVIRLTNTYSNESDLFAYQMYEDIEVCSGLYLGYVLSHRILMGKQTGNVLVCFSFVVCVEIQLTKL